MQGGNRTFRKGAETHALEPLSMNEYEATWEVKHIRAKQPDEKEGCNEPYKTCAPLNPGFLMKDGLHANMHYCPTWVLRFRGCSTTSFIAIIIAVDQPKNGQCYPTVQFHNIQTPEVRKH